MPTELEELVEFLHHGNTEIRQVAVENLVGYSTAQPSLFKRNQLEPVKDLKLLLKDYSPIAKNVLTILVNISEDGEVVKSLVDDDAFVESLLLRVTNAQAKNANLQCMLLANMAKGSNITKLLTLKREVPKSLSTSPIAIDQLLDAFVKGSNSEYNPSTNYDYLSYLFADLSKDAAGRKYLLTPRSEDGDIVPLAKLIVFTESKSTIRRRGVANTVKNICFDGPSHGKLLAPEEEGGIGLLPYLLLPLMGAEEYDDDDTDGLPEACQLLPPDKERETQADIICTHLETLLLLTTEREGRDTLRKCKVYPVMRELHNHAKEEDVKEATDRVVQVIMRDEEGEGEDAPLPPAKVKEVAEDDEDDQIVDVV